jgi:hypothetical protein
MAYIVPRVLIEQEFTQVPVFSDQPLASLVIGPQYNLYRYSKADEKALTAVTHPDDASLANAYQADDTVVYEFPNQEAGTFVDADFVKVYLEKAQVEYLPTDITTTDASIVRVAHPTIGSTYYPNRFKASSLVFAEGNDVDRSVDFSNRDVQKGDLVHITNGTDSYVTKVKNLHATKEVAVIGTITNDSANKANATEDYNDALTWAGEGSAPANPPNNTSSNYDGHIALGIVSDTYTITVTTGSATLADCRFTISSANGAFEDKVDQELNVSDELIIDDEGTNVVKIDYTGEDTPVTGDVWTLPVTAGVVRLVNASTIVGALPYKGPQDITYKLTVVRGGPYYDDTNGDVCARVAITSNQLDSSPTVNVKASTAFKVGSYGLTATISGSGVAGGGLVLGDIYYLPVAAEYDGAVNIIETYESLPADLVANVGSWDIEAMRYVTDLTVSELVDNDPDVYNWLVDADAQTIELSSGIQSYNEDITIGEGAPLAMDVKEAKVFVEHRDLVVTNATSIGSVVFTDEVEDVLGTIDPDNPIAQGVYHSALNSGGVPTYFCSVATNDLAGFNDVLGLATKSNAYYSVVPMTMDRTIQDAVVGHVNAMSTAEEAKWRISWLSTPITESELIYDLDDDGDSYMGTVTDDTLTTGTQYSLLTVEGAEFVTDGVRAGDRVRINFRTEDDGTIAYDTYVVEEVRTETTLVLTTALSAAINVALKVQIERVYTKDEQIDALAQVGSDYNNRRVRMVFPPVAKNGTTEYEGYIVAAALAGLRASVVPHQGLTNTVLLGFTDLSLAVNEFTETQLNRLAEEGYFIVTQSVVGATPYVRHQLTTDMSSLNTSEDSVTTNVDSISHGLQAAVGPFVGTYNIHDKSLAVLRSIIVGELDFRATGTYTVRAGNQLNSFKIVKFSQNATFKDRVDVEIELGVPYPLNFVSIKLIV